VMRKRTSPYVAQLAWLVSLGLGMVTACVATDRETRTALAEAEMAEHQQRDQMQRLTVDAAALISEYVQVSEQLHQASLELERAARLAQQAGENHVQAEAAYKQAERNWRWMTYTMLVAATYDVAGAVCAGVESTQAYRRRMGIVGNGKLCVDHAFAHALGGVNHPWNYTLLDCRENSAYGAAFWSKLVAMPTQVLSGLAASALARLRCGSAASAWRR
jgi:hypothetical protein